MNDEAVEKQMNRRNQYWNKVVVFGMGLFLVIVVIVTGVSVLYFRNVLEVSSKGETVDYKHYSKQYAFIAEDQSDLFWESVYDSAKEQGEESNIYVEQLGKNLPVNYSKSQLLEIAINSQVDGVIIQGDDSENLLQLINEAEEKGIPVVTVLSDCNNSNRQSFVGVNNYHIGQVYGEQVLQIGATDKANVLVLMNADTKDTGQNIIYTGIQDTIQGAANSDNFNLNILAINSDSPFGTEESIRDVFMKEDAVPDIMICLDEVSTTSAYQAVVDFNKVGEVNIIGSYTTDTILNAVSRDIINSTISIDSKQLGGYCVDALAEYENTGHVSEYISVDIKLITNNNVGEYLINGEEAQK
jgi:ribose transport system substrate-binding protein